MSEPVGPQLKAGGGASENDRTVQIVNETIERHLANIFMANTDPSNTQTWTNAQIRHFITQVQQQQSDHDKSSPALQALLAQEKLDVMDFIAWMTSGHGSATMPAESMDLSWPLASYFISSSHNTYLTGNQLSSDSSTRPYTDTLLRGGRCIEIDVWDGSESDMDTSDSSSAEEALKASKEKARALKAKKPGKVKEKLAHLKEKLKLSKSDEKEAGEEAKGKLSAAAGTAGHKEGEPEAVIVEPRVLHGYTLTKEIPFRGVCEAIRDSAFIASDLPVIVSLEVHCSPEQQLATVRIMRETFDGMLVAETETEAESLPSPDELRRKLLIKVKYAPPGTSPGSPGSTEDDDRAPKEEDGLTNSNKKNAKPSKIIQELSRLAVYTRGVSFKSLDQPEAAMPTHIFSLSEKKVLDVHAAQALDLFNHNKRHLMRTYPWGLRIGSSNLDPSLFWRKGIQVVALNWQKWDEGMMLNEGMFAGTGGYVLKPEGYRPDLLPTKSATPNTIIRKTLNLSITVLAAQSIPLPPGDSSPSGFNPYLKIELHVEGPEEYHGGQPENGGHEREGEYKVRSRTCKGVDVDYGDKGERLEFPAVPGVVDELSWVRFTVRDDEIGRDDLAAWACIRLDRLGSGYRFVHLLDCEGCLTNGVYLIKVEKTIA